MTQKTNVDLMHEAGITLHNSAQEDRLDRFASLVEQRLIAKLLEGVGGAYMQGRRSLE